MEEWCWRVYCSCIWICYECGYSDHWIIIVIMIIIIATFVDDFLISKPASTPAVCLLCFSSSVSSQQGFTLVCTGLNKATMLSLPSRSVGIAIATSGRTYRSRSCYSWMIAFCCSIWHKHKSLFSVRRPWNSSAHHLCQRDVMHRTHAHLVQDTMLQNGLSHSRVTSTVHLSHRCATLVRRRTLWLYLQNKITRRTAGRPLLSSSTNNTNTGLPSWCLGTTISIGHSSKDIIVMTLLFFWLFCFFKCVIRLWKKIKKNIEI